MTDHSAPASPAVPAPPESPESPRTPEAVLERTTPAASTDVPETPWPLWEVFVRPQRGLAHTHAGSIHAPDAHIALRNARDLFTRRSEGVSLWVVPAAAVVAVSPDERDPFFAQSGDKPYRNPAFFVVPAGVEHL